MDLIGGRWEEAGRPDGVIEHRSPADRSLLLSRHPHARAQVTRAVDAARAAAPAWALRPLAERVGVVKAVGAAVSRHGEELARALALDVGKPLWEARTEVAAAVAKAQVTVDEGLSLVRGFVPPGAPPAGAAGAECRFRPLGVAAVLGPFNFPLHLPNGHVLPALATGNAVVLKPSELAPEVSLIYARCLEEAGVPPGVFNLVQGGAAEGAALAAHDGVDAVLFTGSWSAGLAIQQSNLGRSRLLALEMGGKNAAVVLADADPDKALYDVCFSAFVSAGQRCTAASRVIVEGPPARADAFAGRAAALARALTVGHPLDDGTFLGPLASPAALRKFEAGLLQARAQEGVEVVLPPGRPAPRGLDGCYASPTVHRVRRRSGSAYEREELFGPDLAVHDAGSLEEACSIANATEYGLAASVHTARASAFERCLSLLECGVVNHNAPTVGASGRLPFGGLKRSGNHRPAGLFAALSCAAPVAILRGEERLDRSRLPPGLRWVDG